MKHLWEIDHPYYATEGCYYVNHTVGHRDHLGAYDGISCHVNYASWSDFKAGKQMPYSEEDLDLRRRFGIDDRQLEEARVRWQDGTGGKPFRFIEADKDYNLLYRWDWKIPEDGDYDEGDPQMPSQRLQLYYILQRKAKPLSVCVYNMTEQDEPEVRGFLMGHWKHMQSLWAPLPEKS